MKILLATSNLHKLEEVRAILGSKGIEVVGLSESEQRIEEPVEDADTFAGNARIKALGYAKATGKRSEEHTSELQSRRNLVCRLLLEKKN